MIYYKADGIEYDKNNLAEFLKKELQLTENENDNFVCIDTLVWTDNSVRYYYQQHFKNVNVRYGGYSIFTKNNKITSISGNYCKIPAEFSVKSQLSEQDAFNIALKYLFKEDKDLDSIKVKFKNDYLIDSDFTIWSKDEIQLTFIFTFDWCKHFEPQAICVNAENGEIFNVQNLMEYSSANGIADTYFSGNNLSIKTDYANNTYSLKDLTRGGGISVKNLNKSTDFGSATDFFDADNDWTSAEYENEDEDMAALDVMWGIQKTFDYFEDKHSWEGYDNKGAPIEAYVHYGVNVNNAGCSANETRMRLQFGDGTGDPITALDVVSHEYGHGLTALVYGEARSISEGLSDIWGACVDDYVGMGKNVWLDGEDYPIAFRRSLENPNSTYKPDTYKGTFWNFLINDHQNSTVLSHWFYLLSEGGEQAANDPDNEKGECHSVSGIGINKASKIIFRTSIYRLAFPSDENITFADFRVKTIEATKDIYGTGSNEERQVIQAWHAVGIGDRETIHAYDFEITGPDLVCSSGTSFSIPDLFEGVNVTWACTGNITRVSSQGSNPCIFSVSSGELGQGTITASISTYCESAVNLLPKNVYLYGIDPENITIIIDEQSSGPVEEVCPYETYYFYLVNDDNCYTSDYEWYFPTGWNLYYSGNNMALANSGPNPEGTLTIDATSSCCNEEIEIYSGIIPESDDCGGYYMMISPNPSTLETILEIKPYNKALF